MKPKRDLLTQMMREKLGDGENEPEPAGYARTHVGRHVVVELFDVIAKELIARG